MFVYPTTFTTVPALLRGWLERVFVPGVAFVLDERTNKVRPGLTGVRRIIGVATYEDSRWSVLRERDNGRRVLLRALRLNTGIRTRTGWIALHDASTATDARPRRFRRPSRAAHGPVVTAVVVYAHPSEASYTAAMRDAVRRGLDGCTADGRPDRPVGRRVRPPPT